jgi:hypothetical protein
MSSISALAFFLFHFSLANAVSPCYMLNGDLATSDFQPCTGNLPSGSNSACCNMGKSPPDICLGGGLCQRMDSRDGNFVIYAVGCTDRSGKDPVCPRYCPNQVELYSLTPCWSGSDSSWCCNNQQETPCCGDSGNSFAFNLTSLGFSSQPSQSNSTRTIDTASPSYPVITETEMGNATSCPVGKSAVIGSSVGAFSAGILIAGLLGLYLASRRLREQRQEALPNSAALYIDPETEWSAELQPTPISVARPRQIGKGNPKYGR